MKTAVQLAEPHPLVGELDWMSHHPTKSDDVVTTIINRIQQVALASLCQVLTSGGYSPSYKLFSYRSNDEFRAVFHRGGYGGRTIVASLNAYPEGMATIPSRYGNDYQLYVDAKRSDWDSAVDQDNANGRVAFADLEDVFGHFLWSNSENPIKQHLTYVVSTQKANHIVEIETHQVMHICSISGMPLNVFEDAMRTYAD